MSTISAVYAREILDSRGLPTVECSLWLDTGQTVTSSAPSGTSKGKYEALELRDGDQNRMNGKGTLKAVENINTIIGPQLIGKDPTKQTEIDQLMVNLDGTPNKSKLGSNATIAVSQAVLKAGAISLNLPIYYYLQQQYQLTQEFNVPTCIFTLINGGEHGADNLDIQEFQVIPASHIEYPTALNMAVTLFHKLEEVLILKGAIHSVGIVGGFTPNLFNNTDAFEILIETIKATPYTFAQDFFFGADMSAASLFQGGKYTLKDKSQPYSSNDLLDYYKSLRNSYHVFYLEDPFQEDDWSSWSQLTAEIGSTTLIAADSMLYNMRDKIPKSIKEKVCNTAVIKPNSLGTISETIQLVHSIKEAGWQIVMSHRSGETNDTMIVDMAVGLGANYVKFGPPNRGERISKYNRLSEIHLQLQQMRNQAAQAAATPPETEAAPVETTATADPDATVAPAQT
jgi:enolase